MTQQHKVYNMNNVVSVQKDNKLSLKEILKGTNVNLNDVKYYSFENGGEGVALTVFDKNKKQILIRPRTVLDLAKDVQKIINQCSHSWFPPKLLQLIDKELDNEQK